ncbi:DUF2963 domain-containing protein [Candidatus Phytoplasma mali]|uniref:DUF2963 domain-containing protein n=1 Tax=Apple proliferation phytoplasma TaxID=37692 RepID=UPI000307F95E|nr:DUF2963 domain-containing protein [Candidatus Phytoplasma mali]
MKINNRFKNNNILLFFLTIIFFLLSSNLIKANSDNVGTNIENIFDVKNQSIQSIKTEIEPPIKPITNTKIGYNSDGKTIDYRTKYHPLTQNKTQHTCYTPNGKRILCRQIFDPQTEELISLDTRFNYLNNGKKVVIRYVTEFDLLTGNIAKKTCYRPDRNQQIAYIEYYDLQTEELTGIFYF